MAFYQRSNQGNFPQTPKEFEEKVVQVNRVSKKTKGGNRSGFSVLVVVGDKKGKVAMGLGKAPDVTSAMRKAVSSAKRDLVQIVLKGSTIPHEVMVKKGAAKVLIKPAPEGSGVIAGGAMRSVLEVAGVRDVVGKIMGSNNKIANVYATITALTKLRTL